MKNSLLLLLLAFYAPVLASDLFPDGDQVIQRRLHNLEWQHEQDEIERKYEYRQQEKLRREEALEADEAAAEAARRRRE